MPTTFYLGNKYDRCARWLAGESGTLLDIGSRDRVLLRYLNGSALRYASADLDGAQHDHLVNLDAGLPFADRAFDVVVALDVLEHVDQAHRAADELFRVAAREVLIALPNEASWQHRATFLWRGRLHTDKYDMPPEPIVDRHRWLPSWPAMHAFVAARANANGFAVRETALEAETPGRWSGLALRAYHATGLAPTPAMIRRAVWRCVREETPHATAIP